MEYLGGRIEVIVADLTTLEVDVIVNAANAARSFFSEVSFSGDGLQGRGCGASQALSQIVAWASGP